MDDVTALREIRSDLTAVMVKLDHLLADNDTPVSDEVEYVRSLPRTKAIEWALSQAPEKSFRPVEIWAGLQALGRDDPKMEIQVTTFDLWQRGRIGKAGRGQYHAKRVD